MDDPRALSYVRYKASLAIELTLWIGVLCWLAFLVLEIIVARKAGDGFLWRNVFEFLVLGLLIWWPNIRGRIRYGYWS